MRGLLEEAVRLQAVLDQSGFRYCYIGGIALQCWGQPRYTQDLDLQLAVKFGAEVAAAEQLARNLPGRIDDAVAFAGRARVYLGVTTTGIPVDIAFGGTDYEERVLDRSTTQVEFGLRVCGAEDLIVMKSFAGRDQDWVDVASVIVRQGESVDWQIIESELLKLVALRGESALPERLVRLRSR